MFKILEISLNFFDFHIAILIFCCFFRKRDSLKYYFKRSLFHSCPILPKSLQISIGFFFNIFEIQISIGQSSFLVIFSEVETPNTIWNPAQLGQSVGCPRMPPDARGSAGNGVTGRRTEPGKHAHTFRMTLVSKDKLPQTKASKTVFKHSFWSNFTK